MRQSCSRRELRLQQTDVALADLRAVRIVWRGNFGVVRLVEHGKTGTQYALKCITRAQAEIDDFGKTVLVV